MRILLALLFALFVSPALAACDPTETSLAAGIATQAASYTAPTYSGPAPIWMIGDSHLAPGHAGAAVPAGYAINGHPVLFAGIPGASFSDVPACYPLTAIGGTNPYAVVFMMGFNDTWPTNLCCGTSVPYPITTAENSLIVSVVASIQALAPAGKVVIASDPPAGTGWTTDIHYKVYAVAKAVRAAAFAAGLHFVDMYQSGPTTNCYIPYPYCAAASGAMLYPDGSLPGPVHYPVAQYKVVLDQLFLSLDLNSGL